MFKNLTTTDKVVGAVVATLFVPYVMPFVGAYYLYPHLPSREYILDTVFPNQRAKWRESFTNPEEQIKRVDDFVAKNKDESKITLQHPARAAYDELEKNVDSLIAGKKPPTLLRVAGKVEPDDLKSMDLQGNIGVVLAPNGAFLVDKRKAPDITVEPITQDKAVISQLMTQFSKVELGGDAVPLDKKDINIFNQSRTNPSTKNQLELEYSLDSKAAEALQKYQTKIKALKATLDDQKNWKLSHEFNQSTEALYSTFKKAAEGLKKEMGEAKKELADALGEEKSKEKSAEKEMIMNKVNEMADNFEKSVEKNLIELHQDAQLQKDKFALIVDLMKDGHNKKLIEAQLKEIRAADPAEQDLEEKEQLTKSLKALETTHAQLTEKYEATIKAREEANTKAATAPTDPTLRDKLTRAIQAEQEALKALTEQDEAISAMKSRRSNAVVTAAFGPNRKGYSSVDLNKILSSGAYLHTPTGNRIQIKNTDAGTTYTIVRSWKSYLVGNQNTQADWEALARLLVAQGCPKGVDIRIGAEVPDNMKEKEAAKAFEAFLRAGVPKELIDIKYEIPDPNKKGSYIEKTLTWENYFSRQTTAPWYKNPFFGQERQQDTYTSLKQDPTEVAKGLQQGEPKNKITLDKLETKYNTLRKTSDEVRGKVLEQGKAAKAEQEKKEAEAKKAEEQKSKSDPQEETRSAPRPT